MFKDNTKQLESYAEKFSALVGKFDGQELLKFGKANVKAKGKLQFTTDNTITVGQMGIVIDQIIRDAGSDTDEDFALRKIAKTKYVNMPTVITPIFQALQGQMDAKEYGAPFVPIAKPSVKYSEFAAAFWGNSTQFGQEDIYLRDLGSSNISESGGLAMYIMQAVDQLRMRRLVTENLLLSNALTTGTISYSTPTQNYQVSYGIPQENVYYTSASWTNSDNTPNQNAWGYQDLIIALTQYQPFLKLQAKFQKKGYLFMNMQTQASFLLNKNNQSFINTVFANSGVFQKYDMQLFLNRFFPGFNLEVIVLPDTWQDTTGTNYRIFPDNKILLAFDSDSMLGPLAEYVYCATAQKSVNINSNKIALTNPEPGPFLIFEDCTYPGSRGGVANPFIEIYHGSFSLPRIPNPSNIMIIDTSGAPSVSKTAKDVNKINLNKVEG